MSKCMDYNEKLEKIKSDHRKLLEIAMESIAENGQELGDKIHAIFNCIEYDEKQANKYKALLDAKYTIENLVNMILNATTPEEIIKIRESLNYYINKIKKEMVSRNLSDDMITSYQRQASYLRKDIAKSIRILKRENNIDSIEGLIMLSDVVIPDDDQTLKKMIRNEMKFNDYYLKPRKVKIPKDGQSIDSPDEEPKKNDNQTIVQNTDYFDLSKRLDETFAILENPKDDGLEIHDIEEAFKPLLSDREIHENVEKNYDAFEGLKTKTIDNSSKYASEKDFLYAMANRFPNIINVLYGYFYTASKESAAQIIKEKNKMDYYNSIYADMKRFLYAVTVCLIAVMPFAFPIFIKEAYADAYVYIPIIMIATYFANLSSFYGGIFGAFKKTNIMGITTFIAAGINLVVDLALVKSLGIYAACISTLVADLIVYYYRKIKLKKLIRLREVKILGPTIILIIVCLAYYIKYIPGVSETVYWIINVFTLIISVAYSYAINRRFFKTIGNKIKNKFRKKNREDN